MKDKIKVGDAVIIKGLNEWLEGKVGEVVAVFPDNWYRVRIGVIFPDGKSNVYIMWINGVHLALDKEANEKLAKGGGVIIRK